MILEFAVNDPPSVSTASGGSSFEAPVRRGFEQLLRIVLQHPARPAIFVLMSFRWRCPFYLTAEDDMGVLVQYYDLPVLSMRAATYHYLRTEHQDPRVSQCCFILSCKACILHGLLGRNMHLQLACNRFYWSCRAGIMSPLT